MTSIWILWICGVISSCGGLNVSRLDDEVGPVVYVNVLYRHGDRNVIDPCPNDPYRNRSFWREGYGQLTKLGKFQQYQLGSWIRKRYFRLLPRGEYERDVIYVKSTDVDRTLMSAETHLAGLFPPDNSETWTDLKWQPIPIHSTPEDLDQVMAMGASCKKYDRLNEEFQKSKAYADIQQRYHHLFKIGTEICGKDISDVINLEYLYSQWTIETMRGFELPVGVESIFPEKMVEPTGLSFALPTWTSDLKRLRGGPLVKEMINNMVNKSSSEPSRRNISMYSGHDTTLGNTMNTLGVYNFISPPFFATLLVELRSSSKGPVVTILYKNGSNPVSDDSLHMLSIPGCSFACPLSEFHRLLTPVIPDNWKDECDSVNSVFAFTTDLSYASILLFSVFSLTLVIFIVFAIVLVCSGRPQSYLYRKLNTDIL